METLAFDHAVIYVPNLDLAISQFKAMGFNVELGGEHAYTHNALIIFNDRSYIELLSLKPRWYRRFLLIAAKTGLINRIADRKSDINWRIMRWVGYRYGPIDWALRTDNIEASLARLKASNIPLLDSQIYQRTRIDGQLVEWSMGSAKDLDVPFLIQDRTAIDLRIPLGDHTVHPNGALGIQRITIAVQDTLSASRNLRTLLAMPVDTVSSEDTSIVVGSTNLSLAKLDNRIGKLSLELSYKGSERRLLNGSNTTNWQLWLSPNS